AQERPAESPQARAPAEGAGEEGRWCRLVPEIELPSDAAALLKKAVAAHDQPVYLVGGAVRDYLLRRPVADLDVATVKARVLAKRLASVLDAKLVVLDDENAVFRLVLRAPRGDVKQLDIAELVGGKIESDLARRDFTVNALAATVEEGGLGALHDT